MLMKLRCNYTNRHLAYLFGVSVDTVSDTFYRMIGLFHLAFSTPGLLPHNDLDYERANANVLQCFDQACFADVAIVLDCTEFFIQTPSDPEAQKATWSKYKNHNTLKVLVGILKSGKVGFISLCYGGRISDKEITEVSGVVGKLWPGAAIMVDKGFHIDELLKEHGMSLVIPPFATTGQQFTKEQLELNRLIANARIHVERVIGEAKRYRMLSTEVPIILIPHYSKVVFVTFHLLNYVGDIVILQPAADTE